MIRPWVPLAKRWSTARLLVNIARNMCFLPWLPQCPISYCKGNLKLHPRKQHVLTPLGGMKQHHEQETNGKGKNHSFDFAIRIMEITSEMQQPQCLASAFAPKKLHYFFAIPTTAALTFSFYPCFYLNTVSGFVCDSFHYAPVPRIAVSALGKYSSSFFEFNILSSVRVFCTTDVGSNNERTNPFGADAMSNVEQHAMEVLELVATRLINDHTSILSQDAEVEFLVQARCRNERRLNERQLLSRTN